MTRMEYLQQASSLTGETDIDRLIEIAIKIENFTTHKEPKKEISIEYISEQVKKEKENLSNLGYMSSNGNDEKDIMAELRSRLKPISEEERKEIFKEICNAVDFLQTLQVTTPSKIKDYYLQPYQKNILEVIKSNKAVIINSSKEMGNSVFFALYALWYALTHEKSKIAIIYPKMSSAKKTLTTIMDSISYLNHGLKLDLTPYYIELVNKSKIEIFSSEGFEDRGFDSIILMDAAQISFSVEEELWKKLLPHQSAGKEIIICSTPGINKGLFYKTWSHNTHFTPLSLEWWKNSEYDDSFKQKKIDEIGVDKFENEYDCEFIIKEEYPVEDKPRTSEVTDYINFIKGISIIDIHGHSTNFNLRKNQINTLTAMLENKKCLLTSVSKNHSGGLSLILAKIIYDTFHNENNKVYIAANHDALVKIFSKLSYMLKNMSIKNGVTVTYFNVNMIKLSNGSEIYIDKIGLISDLSAGNIRPTNFDSAYIIDSLNLTLMSSEVDTINEYIDTVEKYLYNDSSFVVLNRISKINDVTNPIFKSRLYESIQEHVSM